MRKREVEQFDQALQQAAQGDSYEDRLTPLVHTARGVAILSATPPSPPRGLVPGRRRFLLQAEQLRAQRASQRRQLIGALRMAALVLIAVLGGVVLGAGSTVADSLPGQPLYGLKLLAERAGVALAGNPARRAASALIQAEERLDEIATLLEQDRAIESAWVSQAERQLLQALQAAVRLEDAAAVEALRRLAGAVQQREWAMAGAAGDLPAPPIPHLLRVMEQVRLEALAGQGDPDGLRQRLRQGEPAEPATGPGPTATPWPSRTPSPPVSGTPRPPAPSRTPEPSHTPRRMGMPATSPGASESPTHTPVSGATSQATGGPPSLRTPGASATYRPMEPPHASRTPGAGPTSQPTERPQASRTPDPGGTPAQTAGPGHTPGPGGAGDGNKP